MANYFVSSTGSNTAPYDTWAKAATALQTALSAATATGDLVVLDINGVPSADAEVSADKTWTFAGNVELICSTNSGTATITPTAMGPTSWIGNSTTTRQITFAGAYSVYVYGLLVRGAGTGALSLALNNSSGGCFIYEDCYLWHGSSYAFTSGGIRLVNGGYNTQNFTKLINTTIRLGHSTASVYVGSQCVIEGGSLSTDGASPVYLFRNLQNGGVLDVSGCDLSHAGANPLVLGTGITFRNRFSRCRFGSGYVLLGGITTNNLSSGEVFAYDCSAGDVHGLHGYANALGTMVSDTGIYVTGAAPAQSWKLVTTAYASRSSPFVTPWMARYVSSLTSRTPYFEIARDGSTTPYTDAEVWAEFGAKTTSGYTVESYYRDRAAPGATPSNQAAGAGTGAWTGLSGTAWSGKCDSGSAYTPAEVGDEAGRICFGKPSSTVYVSPLIL